MRVSKRVLKFTFYFENSIFLEFHPQKYHQSVRKVVKFTLTNEYIYNIHEMSS